MFQLPVKQIIVNDDSQVVLREDDGTLYADNDLTASTGGFILEGFLSETVWATSGLGLNAKGAYLNLFSAANRMIKDIPFVGDVEKKAFTVSSTTSPVDARFKVTVSSLDLTPTEYQTNGPVEKRYQISAAQASAAAIAAKIVAVINNDLKAKVVAANPSGAIVTLVAKDKGFSINMYSEDFVFAETGYVTGVTATRSTTISTVASTAHGLTVGSTINVLTSVDATVVPLGMTTVTAVTNANNFTVLSGGGGTTSVITYSVVGSNPINTYDSLKNIEWHKNLDFDRNVNWMPLSGKQYNSYYFEVVSPDNIPLGGVETPSQVQANVQYGVRVYVATSGPSTLLAAMDLLVGDVNQ